MTPIAQALQHQPLSPIPSLLLSWYDQNARVLPWRENPSPYRVWISEIMLQQTRVEAVKPYFERFISQLPTITALANAPEAQLMKLWEGLGYYNRARNLQKAAIEIVDRYGGELPASFDALLSLPGIGEYTAGAISSIAFSIPAPAVDGNVLRVISRYCGSYDDITQPRVKACVSDAIIQIFPQRVGDFNQALMELGATVCLPNGDPLCSQCPLSQICLAHRKNLTAEIPQKAKKKPRKIEHHTILLLQNDQKEYALIQRPDSGLLAGLWEFPHVSGTLKYEDLASVLSPMGLSLLSAEPLSPAKHIFTHLEWHMTGYHVLVTGAGINRFTWVSPLRLKTEFALPGALSVYRNFALSN